MGKEVFETGEEIREGAHVYAHSRKDGKEGLVYLVINNSRTDTTDVELPKEACAYILEGEGKLRSRVMTLNSKPLQLLPGDELPELKGETVSGKVTLNPGSCAFFVL